MHEEHIEKLKKSQIGDWTNPLSSLERIFQNTLVIGADR